MNQIKIKYEIEKELQLPQVKGVHSNCLSNSDINCNEIECENCLFEFKNYKIK